MKKKGENKKPCFFLAIYRRNLGTQKKKFQVDDDEAVGGAIDEKTVRFADVQPVDEAVPMHVDKVLRGIQMLSAPAPAVQSFVHGIVDFIPRNIIGGDQFWWKYVARSEDELHKHLMKSTSGKGFRHDPPEVSKTISDSLQKFPELQKLYHR